MSHIFSLGTLYSLQNSLFFLKDIQNAKGLLRIPLNLVREIIEF